MAARVHRGLERSPRRWQHLAVVDVDRSLGEPVHRLPQDLDRLAHRLDADEVASVTIAVVRARDLEVVVLVAAERNGLAQVPAPARPANHGPTGTHALPLSK